MTYYSSIWEKKIRSYNQTIANRYRHTQRAPRDITYIFGDNTIVVNNSININLKDNDMVAYNYTNTESVFSHIEESQENYLINIFPPLYYAVIQGESVVKTLSIYLPSLIILLKMHTPLYYRQLMDITAVDYIKKKNRFEVNYQLLSIKYNQRLCVSFNISEGVAVNSIGFVFTSAGWYEREVWDMFGIFFRNHNDLRRRLTDYGFKGHPLRKDFPITGFVEVRYSDYNKRVVYEKVSLAQEYRVFSLENNWQQ